MPNWVRILLFANKSALEISCTIFPSFKIRVLSASKISSAKLVLIGQ